MTDYTDFLRRTREEIIILKRTGLTFTQIRQRLQLTSGQMRRQKSHILPLHPEFAEPQYDSPKTVRQEQLSRGFPSKEVRDRRNELTWEARMLLAHGISA